MAPIDSSSGHLGIGAVELVERDLVELQPGQAPVAGLAQVLRTPVGLPLVRPRPRQPALGGDDEIVGIGVQRLGDQDLAHVRAVGVGRVDEVDSEIDGPAQHGDGFVVVGRFAPDPLPVMRMAPNPSRLTVRSPPRSSVPAPPAFPVSLVLIGPLLSSLWPDPMRMAPPVIRRPPGRPRRRAAPDTPPVPDARVSDRSRPSSR